MDPEAAGWARPRAQAQSSFTLLSRPLPSLQPTSLGVRAGFCFLFPPRVIARPGAVLSAPHFPLPPGNCLSSFRGLFPGFGGVGSGAPRAERWGFAFPGADLSLGDHSAPPPPWLRPLTRPAAAGRWRGRAGAGRAGGGDSRGPGAAPGPGPRRRFWEILTPSVDAVSASAASDGCHHESGPAPGAGLRQLQPRAAHAHPGRQPGEHPATPRDR